MYDRPTVIDRVLAVASREMFSVFVRQPTESASASQTTLKRLVYAHTVRAGHYWKFKRSATQYSTWSPTLNNNSMIIQKMILIVTVLVLVNWGYPGDAANHHSPSQTALAFSHDSGYEDLKPLSPQSKVPSSNLVALAAVAGVFVSGPPVVENDLSRANSMLAPNRSAQRSPTILFGSKVIRDGYWKRLPTKDGRDFGTDKHQKFGTDLNDLNREAAERRSSATEFPLRLETFKKTIDDLLVQYRSSNRPGDRGNVDRKENTTVQVEQRKASEWRDLFNGRNLDGWQANMRPESFSVQDGMMKAHGINGMSHLFFVGDKHSDVTFKNFELKVIARSEPNSNSGIFFHTNRELRKGKYLNTGYELQLNSSKKEKRKTGSLYAVVDLNKSAVNETEWFEIRLRVEGKRIRVAANGKPVLDYTEPENPKRAPSRSGRLIRPDGGAIAIQAHDPKSIFYFKQIQIRLID